MSDWKAVQFRGRSTALSSWLLVFFVAPFLFDVAIYDEFSVPPLHQPAVIEGQESDPTDTTAGPLSDDQQTSDLPLLPLTGVSYGAEGGLASPAVRQLSGVSLASRPPPGC